MKIKQSLVKDYALACSKEMRAGKFHRVGQDFVEQVEAEFESLIRRVNYGVDPPMMPPLPDGVILFVASEVIPALTEKLNYAIAQIIAQMVRRHPSLGKTLKT